MDEEDIEEDLDEEDLDIGTEIDIEPDSPPWDMYGEPDIEDIDDSNEDTALLRTKAARTEIIVTPISPVIETASCSTFLKVLLTSFSFIHLGEFIARLVAYCTWESLKWRQEQREPNGFTQTRHAAETNAAVGAGYLRFSENL